MPPIPNLPGLMLDRSHPLTRGLVGWWPMNEGAGGGVMDAVVNRGGILTTPSIRVGSTLKFAGSASDYVNIPYTKQLDVSTEATISLWCTTTSNAFIIQCARDDASGRAWAFQTSGSVLTMLLWNGSGGFTITTGTINIADGRRHHCVMTYRYITNGTSVCAHYVDTIYDGGSSSCVGPLNTTVSNDMRIGQRQYAGNQQPWAGNIDSVRLYNRCLSPVEVAQLYADPLAGALAPSRASRLYTAPTISPPAATAPLSSDRLYNRSLTRIFRRGETR